MPLLYVLWTIALLTIIATATHSAGSVSYKLIRNLAEVAREDAVAEAALNRAVLALLDPRPDRRPHIDGASERFSFDGTEVRFEIRDELGRIDLNYADTPLLIGLFRAAGVAAGEADKIADRILDWRDPDDLRRLNGAEASDYEHAGLPNHPRNAPFQTVEELKLVLGVTPALFHRVEPVLTVYSGKPLIDPRVASPLARQALAGGNVQRRSGPLADPQGRWLNNRGAGTVDPSLSLNGRAFRIGIEFMLGKTRILREAVVRLTGDPSKPYWLLCWRTPTELERGALGQN